MHKLHHYHIYDVINTSLPWAGRVWRGKVINTYPRSPSLCSAVPLIGRPFDRSDTNDLISTSPARLRRGGGRRHAWLILLLVQNLCFPTTVVLVHAFVTSRIDHSPCWSPVGFNRTS